MEEEVSPLLDGNDYIIGNTNTSYSTNSTSEEQIRLPDIIRTSPTIITYNNANNTTNITTTTITITTTSTTSNNNTNIITSTALPTILNSSSSSSPSSLLSPSDTPSLSPLKNTTHPQALEQQDSSAQLFPQLVANNTSNNIHPKMELLIKALKRM